MREQASDEAGSTRTSVFRLDQALWAGLLALFAAAAVLLVVSGSNRAAAADVPMSSFTVKA